MGGFGSGRWHFHDRNITVEECLQIDIAKLTIEPPASYKKPQILTWSYGEGHKPLASAAIMVEPGLVDNHYVRLVYRVSRDGQQQLIEDVIPLETTRPYFGGVRWWFRCMGFQAAGSPCGRRVATIYLPSGGLYFRCRDCYNLTYRSCLESHKHDAMFKLISRQTGQPVEAVKRMYAKQY